ncbi:MAG: flagellar basal body L-ring protein FlgH [Acidobacteria bacterium]|nr:MAG: flagellar basal body L-ring protein FlgH [Acidobacteriota bacterium]
MADKARFQVALFVLGMLAAGCATTPGPQPGVDYGRLPPLNIAPPPEYLSEGSLFNESGAADLVADFRARHPGDVLFVTVTESSLGSTTADNKLDKSSSLKLEAPVIFGWENKAKGGLGPDFDPAVALDASTTKSFEGQGETTRQGHLSARIAVRVVAVGSDGRMVVAGSKQITVNHETETLTLAGIVRPEDIGPDNSILSSQIADLTIRYGGSGDVADVARQGWFHRLMAKIWPF